MKWVTSTAKIFDAQGNPTSVNIEPFKYVQPTGSPKRSAPYPGLATPVDWEEVTYESQDHFGQNAYKGWVYSGFLEDVCDEFPPGAVAVPQQIKSFNEAGQYIMWLGKKQYNLCGEFCVAFLAHKSIDDLLSQWEPKAPGFFRSVFNTLAHGSDANISRTTGPDDLQSMLSVYGKVGIDVNQLLLDPVQRGKVPSPARYAAITARYDIILSVNIKGVDGQVSGGGTPHWICVTKVEPYGRQRGYITFYNPYPNQLQRESWFTMRDYMGAPYGLAVERTLD